MSLTRRLLRELALNDDAIERIIAAHAETVDALRSERDEARSAAAALEQTAAERDDLREAAATHQQEAQRLQAEYEMYRHQVETERTAQGRASAIREALRSAGANELALPLLALACGSTSMTFAGLSLAPGKEFTLTWDGVVLAAMADGQSVLMNRTDDSSDLLLADGGVSTPVLVTADQAVTAEFSGRGRVL